MVKSRDPRLTRNYKKQRLVVLARDGYICNYCGIELDDKNATVDHVIPIAKQGNPMDLQNMVSCCIPYAVLVGFLAFGFHCDSLVHRRSIQINSLELSSLICA